ncbi:MAG: SIS domain-containing protein [Actinomycetota bacterium]|nr:SIS domain-containing protein [Actinomycetota bacterium]
MDNVARYIDQLHEAIEALPRDRLSTFGEILYRAYRNEKNVFTLGNGGSASTASHMAADLAKNTIGPNMRRFRVLSLNDNTALLTALANDLGYEEVFSEQLKSLARAGDLLIVLSGSGNSPNVVNAIRCAHVRCAEVAAVVGFAGGEAAKLADLSIVVPSDHYGVIEDVHLIINHILVDYFKARLADEQPWVV